MTVMPTCARNFRRLIAPLALGLILLVTGCYYNGHRNMGATEKWVMSDINYVPKIIGTPFIAIVDAIIGPATMLWDQVVYDPQYHPKHKYFSYAGSRTLARSDMGLGYLMLASIPAIIIDTVWLILTGPIDLIWVLGWGEDEPVAEGPSEWSGRQTSHDQT
jgi:hypothetical protein